jgi:hypothetical protein
MKLFTFIILPICIILFSCSQNIKEQTVIKSDSIPKITVVALSSADSAKKADSTSKLVASLANDTIFAGERIAQLIINQGFDEALQIMGDPAAADTSKNNLILQWKANKKDSIQYFTTALFSNRKEGKKIKQISTSSPSFKTPTQVGCGSTLAFIKIQYPTLKKATETYADKVGNKISVYDEIKEGLAFETNEEGKCILVSVHVKGQKNIKISL